MKTEEELILNNIKLIYLSIKQMNLYYKNEDELQEYYDAGLEGLIKGAKKYDPSSGYKESTFFTICIKNEIKKYLYLKTMPKRFNKNGKDISLNNLVHDSLSECTYEEIIPDLNTNVELEVEKKLETERLIAAVNSLKNELDKKAIKLYFGIDGYPDAKTYEEVASKMRVSRQMINIRIKRGLSHLKKIMKD